MGTWGFDVLADDFAADVHSNYMRRLDAGESREAISLALEGEYAAEIADVDEGPVFWLALAKAEWDTGPVRPELMARVRGLVEAGFGEQRWVESGARVLVKRRERLRHLLAKLETANPRPRKGRRASSKTAPFRPGACLVLHLGNGQFGAAVVLAEKSGTGSFGTNLVGVLDYMAAARPQREDFERRRWLRLTHHQHGGRQWVVWCFPYGFKAIAHQFELVGATALRPGDPVECETYGRWELVPQQVVAENSWRAGVR